MGCGATLKNFFAHYLRRNNSGTNARVHSIIKPNVPNESTSREESKPIRITPATIPDKINNRFFHE